MPRSDAPLPPGWTLTKEFILELHRLICKDIPHPDNRPGLIRDNPKTRFTYVGDAAHGGRYKPPQYGKDIERLLSALIAWHGELDAAGVPALIRAPLVHLYYEQIHPFWDGNGRVGRGQRRTVRGVKNDAELPAGHSVTRYPIYARARPGKPRWLGTHRPRRDNSPRSHPRRPLGRRDNRRGRRRPGRDGGVPERRRSPCVVRRVTIRLEVVDCAVGCARRLARDRAAAGDRRRAHRAGRARAPTLTHLTRGP